jgi:hypothetical protein
LSRLRMDFRLKNKIMKCKECGKEINLQIFDMPPDICWGCFNQEGKNKVLNTNINYHCDLDINKKTDDILQPKDYIGRSLKKNFELLKSIKK